MIICVLRAPPPNHHPLPSLFSSTTKVVSFAEPIPNPHQPFVGHTHNKPPLPFTPNFSQRTVLLHLFLRLLLTSALHFLCRFLRTWRIRDTLLKNHRLLIVRKPRDPHPKCDTLKTTRAPSLSHHTPTHKGSCKGLGPINHLLNEHNLLVHIYI